MAEPPRFETGRLTLRPFGADDVEPLTDIFAHTGAMWDVLSIPGLPEDPRAVAIRRMADAAEGWRDHGAGFWAVAARGAGLAPDGRLIGYCGFVNPARGEADTASEEGAALEVGWAIHPALHRRGLAGVAIAAVIDDAFGVMG